MASHYAAPLSPAEWDEFLAIMRRARFAEPYDAFDERRLRELMAARDPRVLSMDWYSLVKFARVVRGGYALALHIEDAQRLAGTAA